MAHYRKIDTRIWNDEKFRSLSDEGQLVFLFVLTHPNLLPFGAMRATVAGLAAERHWTAERFGERFGECLSNGLLAYDEMASMITIPNFLKYNSPANPNVVSGWSKFVDLLPECPLKDVTLYRVKLFVEQLGERYAKALPEPFANGMPNREHKHKHKHKHKQQQENATSARRVNSDQKQRMRAVETLLDESSVFAIFWKSYPRKVGKAAAAKAHAAAVKRLTLAGFDRAAAEARLQAACEAFAASDKGRGAFCPHPSTWLNQGRYDDDPDAWRDRAASVPLRPVLDLEGDR